MLWGVKVQDGEAPKGTLGEQWADCGVLATYCLWGQTSSCYLSQGRQFHRKTLH